jgi:hypothetical protein
MGLRGGGEQGAGVVDDVLVVAEPAKQAVGIGPPAQLVRARQQPPVPLHVLGAEQLRAHRRLARARRAARAPVREVPRKAQPCAPWRIAVSHRARFRSVEREAQRHDGPTRGQMAV